MAATSSRLSDHAFDAEDGESPKLTELLDAAERGDISEADVVRALRAEPKVWRYIGDLAMQARASFARVLGSKHLALKNAMEWKANEVLAEAAGPNPTALERLLAERIATCWLELYSLDMMVAQEVKPGVGRLTTDQTDALDQRRGRAHKRFLSAIRELATIRRLLIPVLQVNIARQQVIAGATGASLPSAGRPMLPPHGPEGR